MHLFHINTHDCVFGCPEFWRQKVRIDLTMLRLRKYTYCVYRKESLVYTQEILCMHNTLVHALGQEPQRPGTQRGSWAGPRPWTAAFLGSRPGPWPGSLAQCMHKSPVHAQDILKFLFIYSIYRIRTPFQTFTITLHLEH